MRESPIQNVFQEFSVHLAYATFHFRHAARGRLERCRASWLASVPARWWGLGIGWVTAEDGMLARSSHPRSDREAAGGKQSGRAQEIQRLLGRSLRAVFDLEALGERTLHL